MANLGLGRFASACVASACFAACGNVQPATLTDAAGGGDSSDAPGGAHFKEGCVVGLATGIDGSPWVDQSGHVTNSCDTALAATVKDVTLIHDPTRDGNPNSKVASLSMADSCVTISDAPALNADTALTMSAWVSLNSESVAPFGVIAKRDDDSTDVEYTMFISAKEVFVDVSNSSTVQFRNSGVNTVATTQWRQITAVYDGTATDPEQRLKIYIDGVQSPLSAAISYPAMLKSEPAPLSIGCLPAPKTPSLNPFSGNLDGISIWTRALSDTEVTSWHTTTKNGMTAASWAN